MFILQEKYVSDLLKKLKLDQCKEVATPLAVNEKVSKHDGTLLENPSEFRNLVGSLLYMTETKPYLMFPANLLSRYTSAPRVYE